MPRFEPNPNDYLTIESQEYQVAPHPAVPHIAFAQEGRKAIVYQMRQNGQLFALKQFKPPFREARLEQTCQILSQLDMPGLEVCKRQCFTQATAPALLQQYPDMAYAVLMPWVQGSTWFDIIVSDSRLSIDACKKVAKSTADLLATLEQKGFSHCDIAGANVVVNTTVGTVSLIDVEDMFGPGLTLTEAYPEGTTGYQHKKRPKIETAQWCATGDRFAGAVLLAEMLAWHDPNIRRQASDEHYFAQSELQDPNSRNYQLMSATLQDLSPQIAECFEQAWFSDTLEACPPLSEWARLLEFPVVSDWLPIDVPPPSPMFDRIDFVPFMKSLPHLDAPAYSWFTDTTLRWPPVAGAEGYIVEMADGENFTNADEVYQGQEPFCPTTDQTHATKWYRVCAYDTQGTGAWSRPIPHP